MKRIRYFAEGAALCVVIERLLYQSLWAFILLIPIPFLWAAFRAREEADKRKIRMRNDFYPVLHSLSVAMHAGYSAENAMKEVEGDLEKTLGRRAPMTRAIREMNRKVELHVPVEEALFAFAQKSGVEDILDFAEVFLSAKMSGGDLTVMIRNSARIIRDKIRVEKEIESAVAAKKYEQTLMSLLPCGILLYLRAASPGFLDPLYGNVRGVLVMTACLALYLLSFFWGRRIVSITV